MKYFVCSDIHGFYEDWMKALEESGFDMENEDHTLCVCGDLLDRGPDPLNCLKFVNNIPRKILIKGNHEYLMEDMLARREVLSHDIHNGTLQTMLDMTHIGMYDIEIENAYHKMETHPEWQKYIKSVVDYYETPKYIFVHGWIPCIKRVKMDWEELVYDPNWRNGNWADACWYPGWSLWEDGIKEKDKTIVCGHWHCSAPNYYVHHKGKDQYDCTEPFIDDGIICLDACTALSHKVNVVVLEDEYE